MTTVPGINLSPPSASTTGPREWRISSAAWRNSGSLGLRALIESNTGCSLADRPDMMAVGGVERRKASWGRGKKRGGGRVGNHGAVGGMLTVRLSLEQPVSVVV